MYRLSPEFPNLTGPQKSAIRMRRLRIAQERRQEAEIRAGIANIRLQEAIIEHEQVTQQEKPVK